MTVQCFASGCHGLAAQDSGNSASDGAAFFFFSLCFRGWVVVVVVFRQGGWMTKPEAPDHARAVRFRVAAREGRQKQKNATNETWCA